MAYPNVSTNSPAHAPALPMLVAQVKAETLRLIRIPEFGVGVVAVPMILYAMFGLPYVSQTLPSGTRVGAMVMASMACYGIVSLAIFTFGADVAEERAHPWMRRMRATPMPMWVYFAGKLAVGLVFSVLILLGLWLVARFAGGVAIDSGRLLRTWGVLLCGTVAFSTLGYAIAYWFRPKAANAVANLIFLPLAFLSGFFMQLSTLPDVVQRVAPYLPTYHFGQLVWSQMGVNDAEIVAYGALTPGRWPVHVAWVVGSFVVFGVVTALGYRRDADRARS